MMDRSIGNVSINLSLTEFRELIEKIQAVALDIQEHEYPSDIRIGKLSNIHEYTAYLLSMANTKEAADNIKELYQIKLKYEFGKHFDKIHSFLFELDFWEITELIGEEFDKKISFKSKNGCFVLNCKLVGDSEVYKIKRLSETDCFVDCGFDTIFIELEKLEK